MTPDFHTHHVTCWRPALVSASDRHCAPLVSKEIHPWFLPEKYEVLPPEDLTGFAALGEIGLDRLRGPDFEVQRSYLHDLLKLAADNGKPVVLHVVRAFPEIFSGLKPFSLRWMIHGFRGGRKLLEEIWRRGGIVSFHPAALNDPEVPAALKNPGGGFGFESDDDAGLDPDAVLMRAIELTGNPAMADLVAENFQRFIHGDQ